MNTLARIALLAPLVSITVINSNPMAAVVLIGAALLVRYLALVALPRIDAEIAAHAQRAEVRAAEWRQYQLDLADWEARRLRAARRRVSVRSGWVEA